MAALVAGERDPKVLAQTGPGPACAARSPSWKRRSPAASPTITRSCCATMLARVDEITADIAAVEPRIEEQIAPFAEAVTRLDEIPGIGLTAAQVIIAEIGAGHEPVPHPGHLVSWARFAPGVSESAGRKQGQQRTGHGNRYLARVLGEAAVGAGRTDTFLGERYRRIARRRGKKKAIVAVGRSILVIVWHLLSDDRGPLPRPRPRALRQAHRPRTASSATTSANSKPSATPSPSNPPPIPPYVLRWKPSLSGGVSAVISVARVVGSGVVPGADHDEVVAVGVASVDPALLVVEVGRPGGTSQPSTSQPPASMVLTMRWVRWRSASCGRGRGPRTCRRGRRG